MTSTNLRSRVTHTIIFIILKCADITMQEECIEQIIATCVYITDTIIQILSYKDFLTRSLARGGRT